ncbi:MAG: DUF349 domain-containing protein [Prevotella sp.]|nr:DUF349 domain-containing protein [Prevotella sp.]
MEAQTTDKIYTSGEEVLGRVNEIIESGETISRDELDLLKTLFYKFLNAERDEKQKAYIEAGGDPETYQAEPDANEEAFKEAISKLREQRAETTKKLDEERQQNLNRKLEIIERIKEMGTSPDEATKTYQEFKALQTEWKELGALPPERSTEVWRQYQHAVEQFYDLLKLNFEARDYDFKKNLEIKTELCEQAEKLAEEKDVVSAFHQLQTLHARFRETGPVAKELREEIWNRFKAASSVVNKAHQAFFERLRADEESNLRRKTELCEKAENIAAEPNNSSSDWDKHSRKIIELQAEWKSVGFAPHKVNVKIFERFRAVCDRFFKAKNAYFKEMKATYSENIAKKRAIVERAKELSSSTDWSKTANDLIALQKEWKEAGAVPHRIGNKLWTAFRAECDKFFNARSEATAGTRGEEKANLARKRAIIAQVKELGGETDGDDIREKLQALQEEFNSIGHVPFRDKNKLYDEYHTALDQAYSKVRGGSQTRKIDKFIADVSQKSDSDVEGERSKLMRVYDAKSQEIKTYENNLGFLSATSKKGNALVDELTRKVEKLKEDLELVKGKIKAIDEQSKE